jgi:hypothetical protein
LSSSFRLPPSSLLFDFPKNATFGRILPKNKIYEHAKPGKALRELFIRQIEQITWQYKLAPETINVKGTTAVPEIQIFAISLKNSDLTHEVLRCIDQAIHFPIIYELVFDGKRKPVAAFKRPSEADSAKWVISDYFEGQWVADNIPRRPLPITLDLDTLYTHLLAPLMPHHARSGESMQAQVERMEQIRSKQQEIKKCEIKLRNEKQFNRKVEINSQLRNLKRELEDLIKCDG